MFRWLLAIFIVVPILELWGLISVGKVIGGWQTVLLVLLTGIAGAYIAKREGRIVWQDAKRQLAAGQMPAGSVLDGACILAGGLFLLLPGFFSDIVGILLLLPLTRPLAKVLLLNFLRKQIAKGGIRPFRRF